MSEASIEGFPPIAGPDARVLVLGSMPSVASLQAEQYYGHPRNAFWPVLGHLLGFEPTLPYAARCERLVAAGVAVWDVLRACERPGSLDGDIVAESEVPNDFAAFFGAHPHIEALFFNGAKAETSWRRHVADDLEARGLAIRGRRLPSTSPAMASLDLAGKRAAWRPLIEVLKT